MMHTNPPFRTADVMPKEPAASAEHPRGTAADPGVTRAAISGAIAVYGRAVSDVLARRGQVDVLDGRGAPDLASAMRMYLSPHGLRVTAATDRGVHRERNEDRVIVNTAEEVYAVIDGMGGHDDGDKAADAMAGALIEYPHDVTLAVSEAQERFRRTALSPQSGVCFHYARFHFDDAGSAYLEAEQSGDVRLLVLDAEGNVLFESMDNNLTDMNARCGYFEDPDEALYDRSRNIVLKSISSKENDTEPTVQGLMLPNGSTAILLSDGITDNVTTGELIALIRGLEGPDIVRALSDATQNRMLRYKEIQAETPDDERKKKRVYGDGFKSRPKPDNRAIIVIEIP